MSRAPALALACLALCSLSLHTGPLRAPARPPRPVARVAPAPPAGSAAVRAALERHATGLTPRELDALARTVASEALRHDLPVDLVVAVMHVESRFDNFAVSPVGAMGLMQILPDTGEELAAELDIAWLGPQTLFDPLANVKLGTAYLKWLERRYGRLEVALAAYNWGPGRIDSSLRSGRPVPAGYARDVLAVYGRLRRSSGSDSAAAKPSSAAIAASSPPV